MSAAQHEFDELMRDKERRTGHPQDDDNGTRSFLDLSDASDDDDDTAPPAPKAENNDAAHTPSISTARNSVPRTRFAANTGPKGVISDAQDFRDSKRKHRSSLRPHDALPSSAPPTAEGHAESDGEDSIDDEGDEDFMQKWRLSRFKELQNGARDSKLSSRERSKWVSGGLTMVDGNGYLDAVDNSPPDTVVIVYIFDDYSQVSGSIEDCLRSLAQEHLDARFIKLHFEDAEMEPAGVPALLAYRGGDKFAGLVPLIQEIPDDAELSASTLEALLKRHQILR